MVFLVGLKLLLLLSITVFFIYSLLGTIRLPGNPSNYLNLGTDIVFKYEIVGCGSLIKKIEEGGAAIYKRANLPEPESGVYEIQLTHDSDEPQRHIESGDFYTAGIAGKYLYYMTVERFFLIGFSANYRLLTVSHCYRENEEVIRIISARKATKTEQKLYGGGV